MSLYLYIKTGNYAVQANTVLNLPGLNSHLSKTWKFATNLLHNSDYHMAYESFTRKKKRYVLIFRLRSTTLDQTSQIFYYWRSILHLEELVYFYTGFFLIRNTQIPLILRVRTNRNYLRLDSSYLIKKGEIALNRFSVVLSILYIMQCLYFMLRDLAPSYWSRHGISFIHITNPFPFN